MFLYQTVPTLSFVFWRLNETGVPEESAMLQTLFSMQFIVFFWE